MRHLYVIRGCPFGHRAAFAMREKGLDFEAVFFEAGKRPPELEALGPLAKSPTLFDEDDVRVWDSGVILEYLEERYHEPALLPRDVVTRAEVRMTLARGAQDLGARLGAIVAELVYKPAGQADPGKIAAAKQGLDEAMPSWDRALAGKTWLCGGALTLADVAIYTSFAALGRHGWTPLSAHANVHAWLARVTARPASALPA